MNEKEIREHFAAHPVENQVEFEAWMTEINAAQFGLVEPYDTRLRDITKRRSNIVAQKSALNIQLDMLKQERATVEDERRQICAVFHELKHAMIQLNPREKFVKKEGPEAKFDLMGYAKAHPLQVFEELHITTNDLDAISKALCKGLLVDFGFTSRASEPTTLYAAVNWHRIHSVINTTSHIKIILDRPVGDKDNYIAPSGSYILFCHTLQGEDVALIISGYERDALFDEGMLQIYGTTD